MKNDHDGDSDSDSDADWDDEFEVDESFVDQDHEDWPWILAIKQHKEQIGMQPKGVPVEIIPGKLYIGDSDCVREEFKENLRGNGITAVLNMAANKGSPADEKYVALEWKNGSEDGSFLYKAIAADDHKEYPLLRIHWDEAKAFLDRAINGEN